MDDVRVAHCCPAAGERRLHRRRRLRRGIGLRATGWRQFVSQGLAADRGGLAAQPGLRQWWRYQRCRGHADRAAGRAEAIDEVVGRADYVVYSDRPGGFAMIPAGAVRCGTGAGRRY